MENQGGVMSLRPKLQVQVDHEGRLVLPPEVAPRYALKPGSQVHIDEEANGLHLHQPITHLAKVYVESTNPCNLECRSREILCRLSTKAQK